MSAPNGSNHPDSGVVAENQCGVCPSVTICGVSRANIKN